jgi:hypothetical protein
MFGIETRTVVLDEFVFEEPEPNFWFFILQKELRNPKPPKP